MAIPAAVTHLSGWDNYYVIVGSSAGALIGLQFVVMTLITEMRRTTPRQISAFGTPTVIHFTAALLIAAVMSAPWESLAGLRAILGGFGILGSAYSVRALLHALQQKGYEPVAEDWIWYAALPMASYGVLFMAAFLLMDHPSNAFFLVATVAMTLLLIGIHNSWDTVTYIVLKSMNPESDES
jgi:hypothetical protein